MGVLVLGSTSRQAAGGGRGGKLQSLLSRGVGRGEELESWGASDTDWRVEHRGERRTVEDEGVRSDDQRGGRAGVRTGLGVRRCAGVVHTTGEGLEQLGMPSPGLPLSAPTEVAAPRDTEAEDDHGQQ